MGRVSGLMAFGAVVLLGAVALVASEKPPAEYVKAMKDINAANMALRGHVTAKDYDAIAKDAAAFKAPLEAGQKYWTDKKVEDATSWAKDAIKAAGELEEAAKAKNDDGIAAARKSLGATCQACHNAHRERTPDGTFEIK
jgi:cytochrome c556